ncbi:MAG: redox-regulated ATPase YchF [Candidatus Parcubacteria bacterium]|nr:redox-regulated ATPase YchF [Candidatus Parcubacteria bacterium]
MSLSIGIVGLPNVGKSTLFKVLTKKQVDIANYPFCTIDPNVGVVQVPDERVEKLAEFSRSKKIIFAAVEFVDIAGLVKGAAEGEGLGNKFLSRIREVDVIVEVVRVFENKNIIHVHNKIDPENDIDVVETELILADLETVSKKTKKDETEVIKKLKSAFETGKPAREIIFNKEEMKEVKALNLLTIKPVIYVYNISGTKQESTRENSIDLDFKLEEDILDMNEEEKKELGVESGIDKLIVKAYQTLDLITFLTTGEDETRAWTVKKGSTAPEAGAAIHTDFKEKFIKAEVINWQKLLEGGLTRTVGKDYIIQDGDVIEFKI